MGDLGAIPVGDGAEFLRERRGDVHHENAWSPFRYVARRLRETTREMVAAAGLSPGDVVVDYGCADVPYRDLFEGVTYRPADLPGNPEAELELRPDGSVPLPDGCCRLVLSTQVLEHVPDPAAYLAESFRLLEPGGSLALTTHGLMYLHRDPTDYWRWTCDGLARVITDAGYDVVELRGILGLVPAALQLMQDGMGSKVPRRLRKPYVAAFQALISLTDRRTSDSARNDNALVFAVLARKPG
jgi:SAM-dependent methyltransferase